MTLGAPFGTGLRTSAEFFVASDALRVKCIRALQSLRTLELCNVTVAVQA
jgi:hypothetical protein